MDTSLSASFNGTACFCQVVDANYMESINGGAAGGSVVSLRDDFYAFVYACIILMIFSILIASMMIMGIQEEERSAQNTEALDLLWHRRAFEEMLTEQRWRMTAKQDVVNSFMRRMSTPAGVPTVGRNHSFTDVDNVRKKQGIRKRYSMHDPSGINNNNINNNSKNNNNNNSNNDDINYSKIIHATNNNNDKNSRSTSSRNTNNDNNISNP